MRPILLLAAVLAAAPGPAARAGDAPRLEGTAWLEDATGALGPGDVLALPASSLRSLQGTASAGFGTAPRWIRAELVNPRAEHADAVLAFEFPLVDTLDLFLADGEGGFEARAGGLGRSAEARAIAFSAGAHVTTVRLAPGERRALALRIRTPSAGFLGLGVYDADGWRRRQLVLVLSALGVGGLLVLLALSARFGLRRRRRMDLDAWAFLACQTVHVGVASGLVPTLLELPPATLAGAKALFAGVSAGAGVLFVRAFAATRDRHAGLERVLVAGAALAFAANLVIPFDLVAGNLAVSWTGLLAIGFAAVGLGEAVLAGHRPARTLLPGLVLFAGATGWYLLSLVTLAPPSPYVVLVETLGAVVTGVFITLAISRQDEIEVGSRTGALEALVAERTSGLREALGALQAESAERRDAEERFRLAFGTSPDPMVITRLRDGLILAVNPGFCALHGVEEEGVLGRTVVDLGLWLDADARSRFAAQLAVTGAVRDFEATFRGASGEARTCLVTAGVLRQGGVDYVFSAGKDVTEARATAARRQRLEEDLRQAQKLEAVGRLAAGVAHDFNNLLTAISANVGMAHASLASDHADREHLDDALEAVKRATGLTRQLLTFTRRQAADPRPVDVDELVRGMARMLGRLLGEDVHLDLALAGGLPRVQADPGQLEQVVLNLVLNARDAVGPGGRIALSTGLERGDGTGGRVRLTVRDDGAGMDAPTLSRIFEPFFTPKPSGRGTGLGLSTVYGIVQAHGGSIVVHSEPGRGSRFEVSLPALPEGARTPVPAGAARAPVGAGETVLVVEDTDMVREAARAALRRAGYQVVAAASGPEALERLRAHGGAVHLLLTDVRMPGMNGPEVAEKVRLERPEVKVLFMTGYGGEVLDDAHVDARDIVEKPFALDELARRVRERLSRPA